MILAVNTESFLDISYDEVLSQCNLITKEVKLIKPYFQAALILKQVTGNVRILVVNPKEEDEARAAPKPAAAPAAAGAADTKKASTLSPESATSAASGPKTDAQKTPAKSPAKPDAKTTAAAKTPAKSPGKSPAKKDDNTIELKKDANGLGISIVGGSDTSLVITHHF